MTPFRALLASLVLPIGLLSVPHIARAAESYDNCTGFIDSLPATISTQGVWCLRKDLSTAINTGNAITIATNNVTIDCNDFKIGGLAAGPGSQAVGISASGKQNATVRHCNVRGFYAGIRFDSGAGQLVEDNRLDNNLSVGIVVYSDNSVVRRNRVYDTGGATGKYYSLGIDAYGSITDNIVSGLFVDTYVSGGWMRGIGAFGTGARADGNAVSGFNMTATQGGTVTDSTGIWLGNAGPGQMYQLASNNHIIGNSANGVGIDIDATSDFTVDNVIGGFGTSIQSGGHESGNVTAP